MVTYSLPIITSVYWIIDGSPSIWIMAVSNLLLNFKFLSFFRIFQIFEKYFLITFSIFQMVYPFLIILSFIIFGFAHAFFILLRSTKSIDTNDSQTSNLNTNMFNFFPASFLAIYLLLTGNNLLNLLLSLF